MQAWSAETYAHDAGFVPELGAGVLEWLAPTGGERILDLGCGDGILTDRIAQCSGGGAHTAAPAVPVDVVGVDSAQDFVRAAAERGLDARLVDGHELAFDHEFDAVFSNAALHWMTRPDEVVAGVARALKPGGRFVAEFGGHGNVAAIITAMTAVARARGGDAALAKPWYFPPPDQYTALLASHGFVVERMVHFGRPTPLPTGMRGWLGVFRQSFFDQFGDAKEEALDDVVAALAPSLLRPDGAWIADYVRLRFVAKLREPAR